MLSRLRPHVWSRDNLARRDSVHTMAGSLQQQMVVLEEKIVDQLNRIDDKLEAARLAAVNSKTAFGGP